MLLISLYYDSDATISRAYINVDNDKTRHISEIYEYVKQLIMDDIESIMVSNSTTKVIFEIFLSLVNSYGDSIFLWKSTNKG